MRRAVLLVAVVLAGMLAPASVRADGPRVTSADPSTGGLLVDGNPFVVKGFNYIPDPIPDTWPEFSFADDPIACANDAKLMGGAGVTAVRIWWLVGQQATREQELACLDQLWANGIGVVWTIMLAGKPTIPGWLESYKLVVSEAIDRFASHPATLVWMLGNELELQCTLEDPYCVDQTYGHPGGPPGILNGLIDHARGLDSNHLVGTTICCGLDRMAWANLPSLQVWGLNHYPVLHTASGIATFDATLTNIESWDPSRPKIFTEMGVDRFHCRNPIAGLSPACATSPGQVPPVSSGEYQPPQASYLGTAWDHIGAVTGAGTVSGVTYLTYSDMWDRCALFCGGHNTPATHDVGNESISNASDGTTSAEWWGVAHAIPRGVPYTRTTSLAFDALAQRWAPSPPPTISAGPVVSPRLSPCAYQDGVEYRFKATWTTSQPSTTEVYVSIPTEVFTSGGDILFDNSIYELAVKDSSLVTNHDIKFSIPSYGRGRVIIRSFNATGQSVTYPPIITTCGDITL